MGKLSRINVMLAILLVLTAFNTAVANDVKILAADFRSSEGNRWSLDVTLQHDDTGWDHYADNWRIVDSKGNILGDRILAHPHVDEQPFTRGLGGVKMPEGLKNVYIEAHDTVHGWTPNRLQVDMDKASGGRLKVETKPTPE